MVHHRATPAAVAASIITATASAIADAVSAALFSATDATCRHLRPSTASRWTPCLITAGASSSVIGVGFAARSTAGLPSPPAFCGRFTRLEKDQRDPFEHPTCPPSHRGSIGRRLRRLYISYMDRLEQHLLLSVDWIVIVRLFEDAARGR